MTLINDSMADIIKAKDDRIEELKARVEALEAWCEQTNQDAYEKWKALEATEQEGE